MATLYPKHKVWKLKPFPSQCLSFANETSLTTLQAHLLLNRGISDKRSAQSFMNPHLMEMADPMLLKDMKRAIPIVIDAIQNHKKITIYGDFDADGITSTALLVNFLSSIGALVTSYIPNRMVEGYGLNADAIKKISKQGTDLIVTVDCGISNGPEVDLAKSLGMEVIITDHHQIPRNFKAECPTINPHQSDCAFPFKDLAGVGVAFFLSVAVRSELRRLGWFIQREEPDLKSYLDLVALGTVADMVPLMGQNRLLVKEGMRMLGSTQWRGIKALKEVSGIRRGEITADMLAFRLAPRLNAPGRLGDSHMGINILTVQDDLVARDLAIQLDEANNHRRSIEKKIFDQIEEMIQAQEDPNYSRTLVFSGEDWHLGVLGIVASRIVDKYHRPSLIFSVQDGIAVGSGRSIQGFNLYKALVEMEHLFEKFGGHARAAGLTLRWENMSLFRERLETIASEQIKEDDLLPAIEVDAEISLREINKDTIYDIQSLAPFGEGNPEPLFMAQSCEVSNSRIIGEKHLKLRLEQDGTVFEAIGFGLSDFYPLNGNRINVVFKPEINYWQGYEKIQLRIVDLEVTGKN